MKVNAMAAALDVSDERLLKTAKDLLVMTRPLRLTEPLLSDLKLTDLPTALKLIEDHRHADPEFPHHLLKEDIVLFKQSLSLPPLQNQAYLMRANSFFARQRREFDDQFYAHFHAIATAVSRLSTDEQKLYDKNVTSFNTDIINKNVGFYIPHIIRDSASTKDASEAPASQALTFKTHVESLTDATADDPRRPPKIRIPD